MKHKIGNILTAGFTIIGLTALASCAGEKFHVTGSIADVKNSLLYFEHNGLNGFSTVDSVKLDEKGDFSFPGDKVDNPEFYRLRIAGQIIDIGIDSTETVDVRATYLQMVTDYSVKGFYENEKIKELVPKQIDSQTCCQSIFTERPDLVDSTITVLMSDYKQDVSRNYIFKEPMRAYSYFALFQYTVTGNQAHLTFDPPRDVADNKVFGAVVTSWDTYYPDSGRMQNLHNIMIKGTKDERIVKAQNKPVKVEAKELGVVDLPLRDNRGVERHLTNLKGKIALLDLCVFVAKGPTEYITRLRELYNKYHDRGLEIYMVSSDDSAHFWEEQVANLPWINAYDGTGISQVYTTPAQSFLIIYLIDRGSNIVKNPPQIKNLEQEIERLLQESDMNLL